MSVFFFFPKQEMLFNDICLAHRGQRTRLLWARVTSSPLSWHSQGLSLSLLGCNHRTLEGEALVRRKVSVGRARGLGKGLCGYRRDRTRICTAQALGLCHVGIYTAGPQDARGWPLQPPQPLSLGEALRLVMQLRGRAPLGRRERGSTGSLTQERCDHS